MLLTVMNPLEILAGTDPLIEGHHSHPDEILAYPRSATLNPQPQHWLLLVPLKLRYLDMFGNQVPRGASKGWHHC